MDILQANHIHFTGIKGVGMTALALCMQDLGVKITGSDVAEVFVTDETLKKRKIEWKTGFNEKNLYPKPGLVVTTGAHGGLNNAEVLVAKEMGIPVMTHAEALAAITDGKEVIAVCGVGGKSTTSAMIATIFEGAGLHPSFAIGVGDIPSLGAPGKYDKQGKAFVVEADEYAVSPGIDNRPRFSLLSPKVIAVTNIEHDHPDIYPTLIDTKKVFCKFFEKVPTDGLIVANGDDKNIMDLISGLPNVKTYGFNDGVDQKIEEFEMSVPGKFNKANATAAALVARFYEIPEEKIKSGINKFSGTRRRFEKVGEKSGILFYDDYAHTPNEIRATLGATKEWFGKRRIIVIFQPHTYSRTKALFNEFARSFENADVVGIMDVYASARETDKLGISGDLLAEEVSRLHPNTFYLGGNEDASRWIRKNTKSGDLVLTLGAGDIFQLHKKL